MKQQICTCHSYKRLIKDTDASELQVVFKDELLANTGTWKSTQQRFLLKAFIGLRKYAQLIGHNHFHQILNHCN